MGIDGRLLVGDGIWLNCAHLPQETIKYLNELWHKYLDVMELNKMDEINEQSTIIFWGENPENLFVGPGRRPLIINQPNQIELIKPIDHNNSEKHVWGMGVDEGVDLDNKELWKPSYVDFDICLNDYYGMTDVKRESILEYLFRQEYELGEDYSKYYGHSSSLLKEEKDAITQILSLSGHSLVGKWMTYHAD